MMTQMGICDDLDEKQTQTTDDVRSSLLPYKWVLLQANPRKRARCEADELGILNQTQMGYLHKTR